MGETRDLHVGIIPDGTRRWATRHLRGPLWDGHEAGEKAEEILFHLADHYPAVRDVTLWAVSVENFQRSRRDQERVFQLLATFLTRLSLNSSWRVSRSKLSDAYALINTRHASLFIYAGVGFSDQKSHLSVPRSRAIRS